VSGCQQVSHEKIAEPVAGIEVYKHKTNCKKLQTAARRGTFPLTISFFKVSKKMYLIYE